MGNNIGFRPSDAVGVTGKVIFSDGGVQECDGTMTVAELMLDHPQHVVVEFDPSSVVLSSSKHRRDHHHRKYNTQTVKKKLTPLPADKTLEPGKIYLMLPVKRVSSKLGSAAMAAAKSEEVRRMIWTAAAALRSSRGYYDGFIPWFSRVCDPLGGREVAAAVEKTVAPVMTKTTEQLETVAEEEEEERPDFLSRQLSGKGWKPSLDTITEKVVKKKVHWLFF